MKYQKIINLFQIKDFSNETINLLECTNIDKEAFKMIFTLNDDEITQIKNIINNFNNSRFYKEFEISKLLEIFILNFKRPHVVEFMIKASNSSCYFHYEYIKTFFDEIQNEEIRNLLYDDVIWSYSNKEQARVIRIYKESMEKYSDKSMQTTMKNILRVHPIVKKYRDYEISAIISLCQNQYAAEFILERQKDTINIFSKYEFTAIETCLEYINKISDRDESIIMFAVEFLRQYNLELFRAINNITPNVEAIGEIIDLFFADNNIHFDLNTSDSIWNHLRILEKEEISIKQTFTGKKALIKLLVENPNSNRILDLLIDERILTYLNGKEIVDLYNELAKNPLENPSCELKIYEDLNEFVNHKLDKLIRNSNDSKELKDSIYASIKEVANVTEYITTVEEYINKYGTTIKELLEEIKNNNIEDFELKTEIKIYKKADK